MSQHTSPTLTRAPVPVRKMLHILRDPAIYTSIGAIAALVGFGTWYYYFNKREFLFILRVTKNLTLIKKLKN